jgi:uncharacterized protein (UPF0276 family)
MVHLSSQYGSLSTAVGCGFKPQHWHDLQIQPKPIGFFEVHAENYLVAGGPFLHHLEWIRKNYQLSIHGVGLSIGGHAIDQTHLKAIAQLIKRFEPHHFSEHLAWSSHGGHYHNDLLPVPYHKESLQKVVSHIHEIQDAIQRPLIIENPSSYLSFQNSNFSETQFLAEIVQQTGCGLLLDVNNVYVSCVNLQLDAMQYLNDFPIEQVKQIHLAGFAQDFDSAGNRLLIDHHGAAVDDAVWNLYAYSLQLLKQKINCQLMPTLIERDNAIPSLECLIQEALMAQKIQQTILVNQADLVLT